MLDAPLPPANRVWLIVICLPWLIQTTICQTTTAQTSIAEEPIPHPVSPTVVESGAMAESGFSVYRDPNWHPVDPRKPCNRCTHPHANRPGSRIALPGWCGRPYRDKEPGGCYCGKCCGVTKHAKFSPYWPSAGNAFREELCPRLSQRKAARESNPEAFHLTNAFDGLANFRLINYHRKDNGYCGCHADPYGCLGESREFSRVSGIGFRQPGQPFAPGTTSRFRR